MYKKKFVIHKVKKYIKQLFNYIIFKFRFAKFADISTHTQKGKIYNFTLCRPTYLNPKPIITTLVLFIIIC